MESLLTGEDKLRLVSVVTGWSPVVGTQANEPETNMLRPD